MEKVMAVNYQTLEQLIIPFVFVAGGLLLGIFFEKIILRQIRKVASRTAWEGDELIVKSIHGMTVFWFFTAGVYGALRHIQMRPSLLDFLQKALLVFVILSVTFVLAKILAGFVQLYSGKVGGALLSTSMFTNITRILVFIIGILVILQSLGISITPLLTALGVGGLAVALALQETLSNLFAGIQIIASKQIKPGDFVKLDSGDEGYITDITWRYTTIRTLQNNMVIIPNAKIASALVTNYHIPDKEMAILVQVGVSYDSDLEKVESVTIDVAKEVMKNIPGGIPEFEPFIRYHTFDNSSINFSIILRGREFVDQHLIKHEFIKRLQKRYHAENIEIPFPIRTIYMRGKN